MPQIQVKTMRTCQCKVMLSLPLEGLPCSVMAMIGHLRYLIVRSASFVLGRDQLLRSHHNLRMVPSQRARDVFCELHWTTCDLNPLLRDLCARCDLQQDGS
mmetsp:Transcript_153765/g.286596  ORF Transcript_153765/g.286596 Transcript_153765/m.286596 type:complete len:101 (+) Transcript_153765:2364-2666(+)